KDWARNALRVDTRARELELLQDPLQDGLELPASKRRRGRQIDGATDPGSTAARAAVRIHGQATRGLDFVHDRNTDHAHRRRALEAKLTPDKSARHPCAARQRAIDDPGRVTARAEDVE